MPEVPHDDDAILRPGDLAALLHVALDYWTVGVDVHVPCLRERLAVSGGSVGSTCTPEWPSTDVTIGDDCGAGPPALRSWSQVNIRGWEIAWMRSRNNGIPLFRPLRY
jgi:hypothetical protein